MKTALCKILPNIITVLGLGIVLLTGCSGVFDPVVDSGDEYVSEVAGYDFNKTFATQRTLSLSSDSETILNTSYFTRQRRLLNYSQYLGVSKDFVSTLYFSFQYRPAEDNLDERADSVKVILQRGRSYDDTASASSNFVTLSVYDPSEGSFSDLCSLDIPRATSAFGPQGFYTVDSAALPVFRLDSAATAKIDSIHARSGKDECRLLFRAQPDSSRCDFMMSVTAMRMEVSGSRIDSSMVLVDSAGTGTLVYEVIKDTASFSSLKFAGGWEFLMRNNPLTASSSSSRVFSSIIDTLRQDAYEDSLFSRMEEDEYPFLGLPVSKYIFEGAFSDSAFNSLFSDGIPDADSLFISKASAVFYINAGGMYLDSLSEIVLKHDIGSEISDSSVFMNDVTILTSPYNTQSSYYDDFTARAAPSADSIVISDFSLFIKRRINDSSEKFRILMPDFPSVQSAPSLIMLSDSVKINIEIKYRSNI